jgi:hypothetical protein
MIRIDWRTIPLPPVRTIPGPLCIAPGERWCANCGTVMWWSSSRETGKGDPCCSRPQPVPVKTFLHPEEYFE